MFMSEFASTSVVCTTRLMGYFVGCYLLVDPIGDRGVGSEPGNHGAWVTCTVMVYDTTVTG